MPNPTPARLARLAALIKQMLEQMEFFREREVGPFPHETGELVRWDREATDLAHACGLEPPPPLSTAGLAFYNPLSWERQFYPNRSAGREWERRWQAILASATTAGEAQVDEKQKDVSSPVPPPMPVALDPETHAVTLLIMHEDWSMEKIAEAVGVARQTLYGYPKFRKAATASGRLKPRKGAKGARRRGHKTSDGTVEAYAEEEDEGDED
jgi:hypothetical protein